MLNFNVPPVKNSTGEPVWKVRAAWMGIGEFYNIKEKVQIIKFKLMYTLCVLNSYRVFFPV